MKYAEISKETMSHVYQAYNSLGNSPLDQSLRALIELRVSQINGCAYCCGLHTTEARKLGVEQKKLDCLPSWQTASDVFFTPKERMALTWTEALVHSASSLELREKLAAFFSEREIVDLTITISLMGALNRISMSLRE